jgi:predicted kinase
MPGPKDHLAEHHSSADGVRVPEIDSPREAPVRAGDLGARLEGLHVGHPSCPRRDDGSRKPSPPDLTDAELPLPGELDPPEPPAGVEYTEHATEVRDRLSQAVADGPAADQAQTIDPDGEIWSGEREALHDAIIDDLYERAADAPSEHRGIIVGGLPGAGKTTVLDRYASIDRSQFLTIDPDKIKEEMARREMIPSIENLSPMEASGLVHEESSHIAKRLANRAYAEGKNVIWDITMSSRHKTEGRVDDLRAAGYKQIEGIFVDIPIEKSVARAEARHRIGYEEYRAGKGEGGRFRAPEVIRSHADPVWGSINRRAFEEVKHRLDRWSIFDNSVDGHPPVLIESSARERRIT